MVDKSRLLQAVRQSVNLQELGSMSNAVFESHLAEICTDVSQMLSAERQAACAGVVQPKSSIFDPEQAAEAETSVVEIAAVAPAARGTNQFYKFGTPQSH